MTIEQIPEILARLKEVGLTTLQTGGDNIRNVVGCPVSGLHPEELLDASSVVEEFSKIFIGNKEFSNLPRKINPAITGCPDNCTHAESQDLAMTPAEKDINGKSMRGFNLMAGGKMGSGGLNIASPLDIFVRPDEAANVAAATILLFRDHGFREARNRCRLAFLLQEWGAQKFRETLEERMGHPLLSAGRDLRKEVQSDHVGIFRQKQEGLNYVGVNVPVGRVHSDQFFAFADLADTYGNGEIRMTIDQNLILSNIPNEKIGDLTEEKLLKEFPYAPSEIMRGLVACTGREYCGLALIETKQQAIQIAKRLERKIPKTKPLTMHWSGCPSGCGNHLAADLGFRGAKTRIEGKMEDAAYVFFKGKQLLEPVPLNELPTLLKIMVPRLVRSGKERLREAPPEFLNASPPQPALGGKRVEIDGKTVAVFEENGKCYGIDAICPHEGGPLDEGSLAEGCVTCPLHNYKFNLKNGRCLTDPSLKVDTYRVKKDGANFSVTKEED